MDYTAKTESGKTIVSVITDKPLTHCVIDAPGASGELLDMLKDAASRWLKDGGCLVIGGGDPDRENVKVSVPGAFAIEEKWNDYFYRIEATSVEEVVELRAKAFPPMVLMPPTAEQKIDDTAPDATVQG